MTNGNGRTLAPLLPPRAWATPSLHSTAALSEWYQMITQLNGSILASTNRFYDDEGVLPALVPITVGSVSSPMGLGSDSSPVQIDLHGEQVYLADSMQFQLEFMLRHGLHGAYYVMPSFRGEDPDATHLNQFFHSEAEIVGDLEDVIGLVERYIQVLAADILASPASALVRSVAGSTDHIERVAGAGEFPRVSFTEAQKMLGSSQFKEPRPGVPIITRAGEAALIEHFGGGVWLTHPPTLSVPFYQRSDSDGRAECADLLLGPGEIVGCGARHTGVEETRAALNAHEVDPAEYGWYLEMKENRPLATAGFGLGLERFLMWILSHDDIRDLHVMPRLKGISGSM
jgi:asparaginyl-tRNA synthetase